MEAKWGILGPELLPKTRRVRSLGLGESVRSFNDLAVPGIGGVWYCKQLMLAALGVAVSEEAQYLGARVQNIEVTNAIEALACWLAFKNNNWESDPRLRGNTKLRSVEDFSFKRARQRAFYVIQPMRMATTQALPALGFVDSESARFNAFQCSDLNIKFLEELTKEFRPYSRSVIEHLVQWVLGENGKLKSKKLMKALSPCDSLSEHVRPLFRERLTKGGNESREDTVRRCNVLNWVEHLQTNKQAIVDWGTKPHYIEDKHWKDLHAGAIFFQARDAAIDVLNATEYYIGNSSQNACLRLGEALPNQLDSVFKNLKTAANQYLELDHYDNGAKIFCNECVKENPAEVLRFLVSRDQIVLRMKGDEVRPGPAFTGIDHPVDQDQDQDGIEIPKSKEIPLPKGISYRVRNLYLLNLDMLGKLDQWLSKSTSTS